MEFERKKFLYNWKNYIYEIAFIPKNQKKYWIAFFADFAWFDTKQEAEKYILKKWETLILEYLADFPEYNGDWSGFLPLDDEDRHYMYSEDYGEGMWAEEAKKYVLNLWEIKQTKTEEEKKQVTFRLSVSDIEKIKKMAEQEGLPYQTLIWSIIHKIANKRIELVLK